MRTYHVNSARKARGACEACREAIQSGQGYKYVKPRHDAQRRRHAACPDWRPSELTGSEVLGLVYAAQENVADALTNWKVVDGLDPLAVALDDAATQVREAAELRRDAAQRLEDGFGHRTQQCDELEDDAEQLDGWADELDDALTYVEEEPDPADYDEPGPLAVAVGRWTEEVTDAVSDVLDGVPL